MLFKRVNSYFKDNVYGKMIYHTVLFSFVGRLMTNVVIYYILFVRKREKESKIIWE